MGRYNNRTMRRAAAILARIDPDSRDAHRIGALLDSLEHEREMYRRRRDRWLGQLREIVSKYPEGHLKEEGADDHA